MSDFHLVITNLNALSCTLGYFSLYGETNSQDLCLQFDRF